MHPPDHLARSTDAADASRSLRRSTTGGDVVLCNLPPYNTQPWLSMGVVLHWALLAQAGIRARVVRPLDPPFALPDGVARASDLTFLFDPTMDERLAAMEQAQREAPQFFETLLDALLDGPERVFALSLFRNNTDVSLHVARLLKQRVPDAIIVLGGPEAIEDPAALLLPWVDVVVGLEAEAVVAPLMERLLTRRFREAAALRHVHVQRALAPSVIPPAERPALATPPMPRIAYGELVPLLVGDSTATMPVLLNWGCPYRCGFCSNRNVYARFTQGDVGRVLDECDEIATAWRALHPGRVPGINVQVSDATTNVFPAQFDALLEGAVARRARWGGELTLRGQTLVDQRVTEARARRMIDAGFISTFFGLETASDSLRRKLRKPGRIADVAAGMKAYHRAGYRGLHFGVPVGIPGETDADFRATEEFVEWTVGLGDTIESITVLPYSFFLSAQDPTLERGNRGARRGLLWRTDDPAGDPAVRARRAMRLFERLHGRVDCVSPFPHELALPAMLAGQPDRAELDRWLDTHGRRFDQLGQRPDVRRAPDAHEDPVEAERWARVDRTLEATAPGGGWALEARAWTRGGRRGRVALFRRAEDGARVALVLEPLDAQRPAFARTPELNISYLKQWEGSECAFDPGLVAHMVAALGGEPRSMGRGRSR